MTFDEARAKKLVKLSEALNAVYLAMKDPTACNPAWTTLRVAREQVDQIIADILRLNSVANDASR